MGGTEGHCTGGATKQTLHLFHGARGAPADRTLHEGPGGGGVAQPHGADHPIASHVGVRGIPPPSPPVSRGRGAEPPPRPSRARWNFPLSAAARVPAGPAPSARAGPEAPPPFPACLAAGRWRPPWRQG